jgi:hypothetical protein
MHFWKEFKKNTTPKLTPKVTLDGLTTLKSMAEVNKQKFWRDK